MLITETINNMFEKLFSNEYEPYQFAVDMENYLFDNYDALTKENEALADYLEEELPEICAEAEPGFDATKMISELKVIYQKAKELL